MRASWILGFVSVLSLCTACGGEDVPSEPPGPPQPSYLPADGVTIERVAIYQGLERDLMKDGTAVLDGVPVVAGRDALIRVFYRTDEGYDGDPVLAKLHVSDVADSGAGGGGGATDAAKESSFEIAGVLGSQSNGDNLATTLNFDVPGESLTSTATFRVEVLRAAAQTSGTNEKASHPVTGYQQLGAVSVGSKVRIVIVPVRYDADGSGRLPDTSPEQLAIYRDLLWKLYPVPEVELRVAEPFPWNTAVAPTGAGWGELLSAMSSHRQKSGAEFDEYYYGLFRATETFEKFCTGGCIAGLSQLALNAFNDDARVGIGIGFSGEGVALTAAHEIGHEHGRGHVPCGTNQGLDPGYPHVNGAIGLLGYDLVQRQLLPSSMKDYMSYCDPKWTSDFTYEAMFERIKAVNLAAMNLLQGERKSYERLLIDIDGSVRWLEPIEFALPPEGRPEKVQLEKAGQSIEIIGQFLPFSHLAGGTVYFPSTPETTKLRIRGRQVSR